LRRKIEAKGYEKGARFTLGGFGPKNFRTKRDWEFQLLRTRGKPVKSAC